MKRLYTIRETRTALGFGLTKVYDDINKGRLVAVKDGKRTYITGKSIEKRIADMKRLETPTMKKAAELEAQGEPAVNPRPDVTEQSGAGDGRQSPRSRFGFAAPRPPAAE